MPSTIVIAGTVVICRFGSPVQTYICMRGDRPSAGVLMFALFDCPASALSCASARNGSLPTPPRPRLSSWATPDFSSNPESYQ